MNPNENPLTDGNQPQAGDGSIPPANPTPSSVNPTPVPEYPQPDFSQPTTPEAPVPQSAPVGVATPGVTSPDVEPVAQQTQADGAIQNPVASPAQVEPVQSPPPDQVLSADSGQTVQQPLPTDAPKPAVGVSGISSKILLVAGLILIVLIIVAVILTVL